METGYPMLTAFAVLILVVAVLYSSVGHGGASGYLAVLTLLAVPVDQAATTALVLNICVAGIAAFAFIRAGNLRKDLLWLLLLSSAPCAFIGASLKLDTSMIEIVLAIALIVAAVRVASQFPSQERVHLRKAHWVPLTCAGGVLGLVSGIIGIGGGIFLSPLLVLSRVATIKQAAVISALFIVANSISGLLGRAVAGGIQLGSTWLLLPFAIIGGVIGSRIGSNWARAGVLCVLLALVMLLAVVKLVLSNIN